jgi:hypothetical protein
LEIVFIDQSKHQNSLSVHLNSMFVCFVQLQLMICRVRRIARWKIALIIFRSDVTLFVSLERSIREISECVGTILALEDSLRLIVIHHVLFEKNFRSKHFVADGAGHFLDTMDVSHVIEERSLSWTDF